jgi:hypothetical protein
VHYTEAMQTLFPSFQAFLQTFSINMKEICKRYLTTAPLYGIIPMMRDLRNKEMYIALDDYKEMYAESCMKRGESLSVNGLKEFIAARQARLALMRGSLSKIGLTFGQYRECGKCEDGDYSSIMTGPDGEQRQEYIVCPYCLKLINDSMQYLGNWQDKD